MSSLHQQLKTMTIHSRTTGKLPAKQPHSISNPLTSTGNSSSSIIRLRTVITGRRGKTVAMVAASMAAEAVEESVTIKITIITTTMGATTTKFKREIGR